jgi:quinol monooxygenase YgiN
MSTHVVTEFKTKPGRAEELVQILSHALPDSLAHHGCEGIALRRNQDDANSADCISLDYVGGLLLHAQAS